MNADPTPESTGTPHPPRATRPFIPDYGIPNDETGLLPWSHVTARMVSAKHYWVCTVSDDGWPHATPVDGIWLDNQLYFGGSPNTRRHRNLAGNPRVCIHLESGTDVVILQGTVQQLHSPERAVTRQLAQAATQKYGAASKPEDYEAGGVFVFRPRVVLAWSNFPRDATRWQIGQVC